MTAPQIQFNDGAAYERFMGKWSQLAGREFLDWLAPGPGLRWLDVGCGNGAFTELVFECCAPSAVTGIDPSPAQLAHARQRLAATGAEFHQGDAMAMALPDAAFDVAVMPLVIFFVPDPSKGVAEMTRVVRPGGVVSAYAWDMDGGGFPYAVLLDQMREMGLTVPDPPSPEASRADLMRELWMGAGLIEVETRAITVHRTFADFDDYWATILGAPSAGPALAAMTPDERERLQDRLRERLPADATGALTCEARANVVKGHTRRVAS